jgi:hypothetical protein
MSYLSVIVKTFRVQYGQTQIQIKLKQITTYHNAFISARQ